MHFYQNYCKGEGQMKLSNRKELPNFGFLTQFKFDIQRLKNELNAEGLLNFDNYNDIKVSSNSKMRQFVISNSFSKNNFFKEESADYNEGEKYKQIYLTELFEMPADLETTQPVVNKDSIFFRQKRLDKNSDQYDYFADELNYGKRNAKVTSYLNEILDQFKSRVTRVRLAYLAPGFSIKPHVDYDPSYIARYHIPIITNSDCTMHIIRNNSEHTSHFEADGRVYFLNAGLKHWASNDSNEPRLHLIVDTHGQDDLRETLVELKTNY